MSFRSKTSTLLSLLVCWTLSCGIRPLGIDIRNVATASGGAAAGECSEALSFVSIVSQGMNVTSGKTEMTISGVVVTADACEQRLMVVTIASNNVYGGANTPEAQDVTFNSVSLTLGVAHGCGGPIDCSADVGCHCLEYWFVKNPAAITADVVVSRSMTDGTGAGMVVGVWLFEGVDQTATFGTSVKDSQQSGDCDVACSSAVGEIVIGWIGARHNHDITSGASQTTRYELLAVGPASDDRQTDSKGDEKIGATTVTLSFDDGTQGSGEEENKCACLPIKPAI